MDIAQLEQEVDRTEQLLAKCDEDIIVLEGLIAHLKMGGGSEIYDTAPPPVFEDSEYRIEQRKEYSPEIFEKSGQDILNELEDKLAQHRQKLPALIAAYQKAQASHEKALRAQSRKT